ncbi:MAG TPA: hypothetical protein VGC79_12035 [Polyangiaceae bacterium]
MTKRHLLMLGLLLGGSALASSACSDTKVVAIESDAGAGGEGGEPGFEFPPSLNPQGVVVIGPSPATSTELLVGASDYVSKKGEVVSLTLASGEVGDSETYEDGDVVATSSAGVGFALERTNDKVHLLDSGKINTTFDLKDPGTDTAPVDSKAYVPVLNQSLIVILDLTEGKVSRRIDLNQYNAAGDSDHSADISEGVYDHNRKIAYFLLQRIDTKSYDASLHLPCTKSPALIVGIDTETDEVADLNGDDQGKALELKLVNPRSLSVNADGSALYLLADGCYEGSEKLHQGVEVVDLSDGTTTIAYEATGTDYLSSMILTGGADALIESLDAGYATHWNRLEIGGALGAELKDVPQAVSFDGKDLIGVEPAGTGKVLRYSLSSETSEVISPTSWGGDYSFASSTALVQ